MRHARIVAACIGSISHKDVLCSRTTKTLETHSNCMALSLRRPHSLDPGLHGQPIACDNECRREFRMRSVTDVVSCKTVATDEILGAKLDRVIGSVMSRVSQF